MPLTRSTKEEILGGYEEAMASAEHAFVIGFKGITVNQVNDLRSKVRKSGGQYVVIKNTLARLCAAKAGIDGLDEMLLGPSGITFVEGDVADDPLGVDRALARMDLRGLDHAVQGIGEALAVVVADVADI